MATNEDVLIAFNATDNVSNVTQTISSNVSNMGGGIRGAISTVSDAFGGLDNMVSGVIAGMAGKSIYDTIVGTSSKAETNNILLTNMADTAQGADNLKQHVDDVTNSSLMSMQAMIPALNGIKSAVGANETEIYNVTEDVANFGSYVFALTGSSAQAESAMFDLSKGIKGLYASLDQYGITEDALMRTNLWSGEESDVEGYMAAVTQLVGSTEELMDTNQGLDARISKTFSAAGKAIGKDTLPIVKDLKLAFLDLNESTGGGLVKSILYAGSAFTVFQTAITTVGQIANSINSMIQVFDLVKGAILGSAAASTVDTGAKNAEAGATALSTTATETKATVTSLLAESQYAATLASLGLTEEEVAQAATLYSSASAVTVKEMATTGLTSANMAMVASEMGVTESELGAAIAHASNATALEGEAVAATTAAGATSLLSISLLPILAGVAIVAALAIAVYEVGKAFGWWENVGDVLAAVTAGISRLWNAFANSPQVQGFVQTLSEAFNSLLPILSPIGDAILSIFPSSGEWGGYDFVGALINIGSQIGNAIDTIISAIQSIPQALGFLGSAFSALSPVTSGLAFILTDASQGFVQLRSVITTVVTVFQNIYLAFTNFTQRVQTAYTRVQSFITSLRNFSTVLRQSFLNMLTTVSSIPARIWTYLSNALSRVSAFANQLFTRAVQAGNRFVTGLISRVLALPSRVSGVLSNAVGVITSFIGRAYSAASQLGSNIVNGAINFVSQLPGKIGEEFAKIPGKILAQAGAIGSAVTDVFDGLVNTALSALGIASPGFVQRAVALEFAQIPGRISETQGNAHSAATNYSRGIVDGFGKINNNLGYNNSLDYSNSRSRNIRNISSYNQMGRTVPNMNQNKNNTTIVVKEGAVQLDSRNLTTTECNQIMINALEGLNDVEEVKVKK